MRARVSQSSDHREYVSQLGFVHGAMPEIRADRVGEGIGLAAQGPGKGIESFQSPLH
jgi:hypothetical protein